MAGQQPCAVRVAARDLRVRRRRASARGLSPSLRGGAAPAAGATEPKTGLSVPGQAYGLPIAGVGCRVKKVGPVGVKVYAVGLYLDIKAAVGQALAAAAADPGVAKAAHLVFARGVKGEAVGEALAERIEPALGKGHPDLEAFRSYFAGAKLAKGTTLVFHAEGGALTTSVDGVSRGTIDNAELCAAVFGAYLGAGAVAPEARDAAAAALLRAAAAAA